MKGLEQELFEKYEKEKNEFEVNFMKEKEEIIESYKIMIQSYEIKLISI